MTLIIAGHHYQPGIRWTPDGDDSHSPLEQDGLFFASDSIITSSEGSALLGGFRKVYSLSAKLWKPHFVDVYFQNYLDVVSQVECVIAFAGNTLTAQHVLNSIASHLEQLRVSYEPAEERFSPGRYIVALHCKETVLAKGAGTDEWADDMFLPKHMEDLLTADVVSDAVEYSINHALRSARRYKLDEKAFKSLSTEFALGLRCPVSNDYRLYCYRMQSQLVDDVLEVSTTKEEILPGNLAVLGRRDIFGLEAQRRFGDAIASHLNPSEVMFEYLNEAIDKSHAEGRTDIDRPSSLKILDHWHGLQLKSFRPADV